MLVASDCEISSNVMIDQNLYLHLHGSNRERRSDWFIKKGFKGKKSLAFIQPSDLDHFFSSPNRLFLAEKEALETEIFKI